MELRQMRYFQAVAREGHFRAAAAGLNVTQPALSQQIRQLERELGVTLFDRDSRNVRLTAAGELLLGRAERILADVEVARDELAEFQGMARGELRLGILYSIGVDAFHLPTLLAEFYGLYPGMRTVLREQNNRQLCEWLLLGEIDLAFLLLPPGGSPPAGIATEALLTKELVVIVAAGHRLARRKRVGLTELRDERFIVFRDGSASGEALISQANAVGFTPEIAFEVSDNVMLRALAAQNFGIAVVPRWCFRPHDPPLTAIALVRPRLELTLVLAWAERFHRPPAASAFSGLARSRLGE